jgi:hypothetical protein
MWISPALSRLNSPSAAAADAFKCPWKAFATDREQAGISSTPLSLLIGQLVVPPSFMSQLCSVKLLCMDRRPSIAIILW